MRESSRGWQLPSQAGTHRPSQCTLPSTAPLLLQPSSTLRLPPEPWRGMKMQPQHLQALQRNLHTLTAVSKAQPTSLQIKPPLCLPELQRLRTEQLLALLLWPLNPTVLNQTDKCRREVVQAKKSITMWKRLQGRTSPHLYQHNCTGSRLPWSGNKQPSVSPADTPEHAMDPYLDSHTHATDR